MVVAIISQAESAGGRVRDTRMRKIKTGRKKEKGEIIDKEEEGKKRGRSSLDNGIKGVRLDRFKKQQTTLIIIHLFLFLSLSALCRPSNIRSNSHTSLDLLSWTWCF